MARGNVGLGRPCRLRHGRRRSWALAGGSGWRSRRRPRGWRASERDAGSTHREPRPALSLDHDEHNTLCLESGVIEHTPGLYDDYVTRRERRARHGYGLLAAARRKEGADRAATRAHQRTEQAHTHSTAWQLEKQSQSPTAILLSIGGQPRPTQSDQTTTGLASVARPRRSALRTDEGERLSPRPRPRRACTSGTPSSARSPSASTRRHRSARRVL